MVPTGSAGALARREQRLGSGNLGELGSTLLDISHDVWTHAISLSKTLRVRGLTVPLPDMVIFACAAVHKVGLEHHDQHYELLQTQFADGV